MDEFESPEYFERNVHQPSSLGPENVLKRVAIDIPGNPGMVEAIYFLRKSNDPRSERAFKVGEVPCYREARIEYRKDINS